MIKINKKYKTPLFASMMLPTMLFGLPAVLTLVNHSDKPFFSTWLYAIKTNTPITFIFMLTAGLTFRAIAEKMTK